MILTRDGKEITVIYRQDGSEVEEVKDENGRLVYSAAREIVGDLPLRYSGRGKPLTDYLISANAVQDGTPSSDAPVDAQGSGARTGNLAPPLSEWEDGYVAGNGAISAPTPTLLEKVTGLLPIPAGSSKITFLGEDRNFVYGSNGAWRAIGFYGPDGSYISRPGGNGTSAITVPIPEGAAFMRICCRTYGSDKNYMLNTGSIPLPYEPYGFKLLLTVNGTEYPIYLGTVPTTRRIKKLVFDGTELWNRSTSGNNTRTYTPQFPECMSLSPAICTHFKYNVINVGYPRIGDFVINSSKAIIFGVDGNTFVDVDTWKSYLASQYANGTPVTVWYVLAEPETGIVNEPLMKIGDYADTVSFAQSQVAIPTVNGDNVLDVPTEVKPSEVYIKGKGIKPTDINGQ